eukprot:GHVR01151576.1.p1 GENE.GHVR01151576.1~~GHVR01151576.1.p1  ORF type:complete len:198 (+),score=66.69 GHVR01151576.1:40-594(+)
MNNINNMNNMNNMNNYNETRNNSINTTENIGAENTTGTATFVLHRKSSSSIPHPPTFVPPPSAIPHAAPAGSPPCLPSNAQGKFSAPNLLNENRKPSVGTHGVRTPPCGSPGGSFISHTHPLTHNMGGDATGTAGVCVHLYACGYVYTCVAMNTSIYMCVSVYVHIHMSMCVCVCVNHRTYRIR